VSSDEITLKIENHRLRENARRIAWALHIPIKSVSTKIRDGRIRHLLMVLIHLDPLNEGIMPPPSAMEYYLPNTSKWQILQGFGALVDQGIITISEDGETFDLVGIDDEMAA